MRRKKELLRATLAALVGSSTFMCAYAQGNFKATLSGYNEIPAVSTTGSANVDVSVAADQKSLSVTLNFSKLVGVAQTAELHFGSSGTGGGIVAYICGQSKPSCPTTATGSVTATIGATDILGLASQGITANDIADVILALENGVLYANISTNKYNLGEVRGQIGRGFGNQGASRGKGKGND